ncbi:hypothetical protein HDU96_003453 [Phlyctochytrium bullatum]|nr:hypothetical protein HDU96_003453 [Phlyctochytrium bullatum]
MAGSYPPDGSLGTSSARSSRSGFFRSLFKGGDRTGIRTTLTRRQVFLIAALTIGIVIGIALSVGLALGLRKNNSPAEASTKVVLVCLDGFKPEYLNTGLTPRIKDFSKFELRFVNKPAFADIHPPPRLAVDKGVSAKAGLLPVWPAQSFPNQYTMLSGLLPAYHGIVGDYFHVENIDSKNGFTTFARNVSSTVQLPQFWGGVPIWVTLRRANLDVGTVNWPGTSAKPFNVPPTYDQPFNRTQTDGQRVNTLVSWIQGINNADNNRPQAKPVFIATHFRDADANGTVFGPNPSDPRFKEVLERVDRNFALLVDSIDKIGMTDKIDIVLVSDHGIASTPNDPSRHLFYEDYLNLTEVDIVQNRPIAYVYPKASTFDFTAFEASIKDKPNVKVYIRGRTEGAFAYPAEFRSNPNQERIPPIAIMPNEGYTFFYRTERSPDRVNLEKNQLGAGGYDVDAASMIGIFAARGPSFKTAGAVGGDKPVIRTVDIYPLLTKLIGVPAEPNNGTLSVFADMLK